MISLGTGGAVGFDAGRIYMTGGVIMSIDTVFLIVNNAVLPLWLLLIVLPHHKITNILVHSGIVPIAYGLVYTGGIIVSTMAGGPEGASMTSLEGLMASFSSEQTMLVGWVHYLVFDLIVRAWIVRDAKRESIPHWVIIIPILATLMTGPLGLLLYIVLRWFMRKRFTLHEGVASAA